MEFETYEEVIDSYNSGVGVEPGDSLTDYIKKNNTQINDEKYNFLLKLFDKAEIINFNKS